MEIVPDCTKASSEPFSFGSALVIAPAAGPLRESCAQFAGDLELGNAAESIPSPTRQKAPPTMFPATACVAPLPSRHRPLGGSVPCPHEGLHASMPVDWGSCSRPTTLAAIAAAVLSAFGLMNVVEIVPCHESARHVCGTVRSVGGGMDERSSTDLPRPYNPTPIIGIPAYGCAP